MEITYFIIYSLLLFFYTLYYLKFNHELLEIIENNDAKAFWFICVITFIVIYGK